MDDLSHSWLRFGVKTNGRPARNILLTRYTMYLVCIKCGLPQITTTRELLNPRIRKFWEKEMATKMPMLEPGGGGTC